MLEPIFDLRSSLYTHPTTGEFTCSRVCKTKTEARRSVPLLHQTNFWKDMRITDLRSSVFVLYTRSRVCIKRRPKTTVFLNSVHLFYFTKKRSPGRVTFIHFYNIKHNISLLSMWLRSSVFGLRSSIFGLRFVNTPPWLLFTLPFYLQTYFSLSHRPTGVWR